ncbi:hypothetical protein AAZX31_18G212900 [Glycine max]|uniref:Uncharacterized protein n=1 Tax=Glycine max TaxID=3847 RepID=I1N3P4_SOYBN|nr:uncharacterized protein LOC100804482 [Glycine max]KAG4925563.1 hypothetical protein JHK87_051103 [Glycine soja]KAG4922423.1 hypothetical protein JHK86_051236 [Glycine max]KAG4937174.1 hypothetical protein JHK85_052093 [Glycine max]KAG5092616.1 hypothetical protein JHK82_051394 [Glycine max]KAG5095674.1 hypothetical protein JHK84_051262 [Glycine max]|eukprot:XP_003552390.1 uncharacterized protein LOC100804482 [Glycine max]
MNPQADRVVRRVTMIATITASYFLLTADYEPTVLDPIKKGLLSAESTVKEYVFGSKKQSQENQMEKLDSNKEHP